MNYLDVTARNWQPYLPVSVNSEIYPVSKFIKLVCIRIWKTGRFGHILCLRWVYNKMRIWPDQKVELQNYRIYANYNVHFFSIYFVLFPVFCLFSIFFFRTVVLGVILLLSKISLRHRYPFSYRTSQTNTVSLVWYFLLLAFPLRLSIQDI